MRDEESNACSGLAPRLLDVGGVKRNRGGVKIPPVGTACGGDASAPTSTADTNRANISDRIILINMLDGGVDARCAYPLTFTHSKQFEHITCWFDELIADCVRDADKT